MKKIFTILILSSLFAGELEVEGDLTVTGDIISPTIDALSGMKPDRIYRYVGVQHETKGLTVPNNKLWLISSSIPKYSGHVEIHSYRDPGGSTPNAGGFGRFSTPHPRVFRRAESDWNGNARNAWCCNTDPSSRNSWAVSASDGDCIPCNSSACATEHAK